MKPRDESFRASLKAQYVNHARANLQQLNIQPYLQRYVSKDDLFQL